MNDKNANTIKMSESIVKSPERVGNFTSSKIHLLIPENRPYKGSGFQKGGYTYIKQRKQERKRKGSLSMDVSTMSTVWGDLMEEWVYDKIGIEYTPKSDRTITHSNHNFWTGTPDLHAPKIKVGEVKGYEPKAFCDYADVLERKDVALLRDNFPLEYWQIVSNAILLDVSKGEAILAQPKISEAQELLEILDTDEKKIHTDAFWYEKIFNLIYSGNYHKLPLQPDESGYDSVITFEFEIPNEDKELLERRIIEAEALLNEMI